MGLEGEVGGAGDPRRACGEGGGGQGDSGGGLFCGLEIPYLEGRWGLAGAA